MTTGARAPARLLRCYRGLLSGVRLPGLVSAAVALEGVELAAPETPVVALEVPAALPEGNVLAVPPVAVAFGDVYVGDAVLAPFE